MDVELYLPSSNEITVMGVNIGVVCVLHEVFL